MSEQDKRFDVVRELNSRIDTSGWPRMVTLPPMPMPGFDFGTGGADAPTSKVEPASATCPRCGLTERSNAVLVSAPVMAPELHDLAAELAHARRKFPHGRLLVEALCEELGEAARSEDPASPGNREWLQVACVAMRLYTEGCPDARTSLMRSPLVAIEAAAREILQAEGEG